MKLTHLLASFDTATLDQISTDKIDEAISLRLPQQVIVQEIVSALSSQSYISGRVLYGKPPTFAMLNLILQASDYSVPIEGFRDQVLGHVSELSSRAAQSKVTVDKNPVLYTKILKKAWENDGIIDKNESQILELLKFELNIWDREHFMLMHDESIIGIWDMEQEFYIVKNTLLATGIIMIHEDRYIIAEEVAEQIRKVFGIEIMDSAYRRLLNGLSREDLALILNHYSLNISGTKDAMIDRILKSLIPATEVLNQLHLESLRELCRRSTVQISGVKSTVIANVVQFFDQHQDLLAVLVKQPEPIVPPKPEVREMDQELYARILLNLTGQQLYDILSQSNLMTSGSKEEKIKRIVDSYLSERSAFHHLRKDDIAQLCRKFSLQISGSKQELIDRLLDYVPPVIPIARESEMPFHATPTSEARVPESIAVIQESIPLPPNWEYIESQFADLSFEEKVVLAILKDAKSINEQDLERIVAKHRLSWVMHKAHMAELMAKLKRQGKIPIQIKSVQNNNIYQWTNNDGGDDQVLEKKSARDIIDALRHGVVPRHNLGLLMVGQQTAKNHLSEILLELNSSKSHFKFIRGQYGSGKTFLCSWLKEFAIDNEFAVSFMNISHDQPLSDLPVFFSGMIAGLRTPEKTDSSALVDILEAWLLNIHNKTAKIEGIMPNSPESKRALKLAVERTIEVELANLSGIEPGFSQALRAFYEGKVSGDLELTANAVAWITGSRSLSAQALRDIGVKGYLEASNVFARMRSILEIINGARYKGLLLLVDELELVRKFPHARQREQALETLRLLIDEAGKNALPGCLLIFTGTDEFFEDERYGLRSYEALAERVMTLFNHQSFVSMRQPIISLESLDQQRLNSVVLKIRDLYGIAYSCDAKQFADDATILQLIQEWTLFGDENIDRKPRPVLREFIQMLDLCEENKGVSLSQFLKKTSIEMPAPVAFHAN